MYSPHPEVSLSLIFAFSKETLDVEVRQNDREAISSHSCCLLMSSLSFRPARN